MKNAAASPVADFVRNYGEKNYSRFHMPGHKGREHLGIEKYDITEIPGADSLYEAKGILAESEKNASEIFGTAATFYAAGGSSQCIGAMLHLASMLASGGGEKKNVLISGRNVHKSFLHAAALLDLDVRWIYPEDKVDSLCRGGITPEQIEEELEKISARDDISVSGVYVTGVDYLGGTVDIRTLSKICRRYGTRLLVDNAHGAYLHFLEPPRHPMDLGADFCCDSAHKTLPVLTGGAYLHIGKENKEILESVGRAKSALGMFGSTSPSYLILASLDMCNAYLSSGGGRDYRRELKKTIAMTEEVKASLRSRGFSVCDSDPLRITIAASPGQDIASLEKRLMDRGVFYEYADAGFLVFMVSADNDERDFARLLDAMGEPDGKGTVGDKSFHTDKYFSAGKGTRVQSIRKAMLSPGEILPVSLAKGRVCRDANLACPPAIPVLMPGELVDDAAVKLCRELGIAEIEVVLEQKGRKQAER